MMLKRLIPPLVLLLVSTVLSVAAIAGERMACDTVPVKKEPPAQEKPGDGKQKKETPGSGRTNLPDPEQSTPEVKEIPGKIIKTVPKARKQSVPVSLPIKVPVKPVKVIKPKIIKQIGGGLL